MNTPDARKRILWLLAIAGTLIAAIVFVSLLAPSPNNATAPDDVTLTPSNAAADIEGGGSIDNDETAEADRPGFSLGLGATFSLMWRLGLVVVVIAGAVVGLRWWGRKTMAPKSTTGFIRLLDTLAINNGRTIHLVGLGDRVIVVGATAQQLAYLNELTPAEAEDVLARMARDDEPTISGFAAELFQSLKQEPATRDRETGITRAVEVRE